MKDELDEILDQIDEDLMEKELKNASFSSLVAATKMAMTKSLENASRPLHLNEWVGLSPFDSRGRKVHPDYLFESDKVKEAVLQLVKRGQVLRLGQMTFYSKKTLSRVGMTIKRLLKNSLFVLDPESLMELIVTDAEQDVLCEKIVGFMEPEIIIKAVEESSDLAKNADGNIYYKAMIGSVAEYVYETAENRFKSTMTPGELFAAVARIASKETYLWEALHDSFVRESVIEYLVKKKKLVVSQDEDDTFVKIVTKKGKVSDAPIERFRSLDDE